jgi:hypothetical protein
LWGNGTYPLDWPLRFRDDVIAEGLFVSDPMDRTSDLAKAVHALRRQGMVVSFPMQTAEGEIIFVVGEDFTLTADQLLELLEREELHAEGVRRLVAAQTEKPLGNEGRRPAP